MNRYLASGFTMLAVTALLALAATSCGGYAPEVYGH